MPIDKRYPGTVVIKGIGTLVSGDYRKGILDADSIIVKNGYITHIGKEKDLDFSSADHVIDVDGQVVCPGFIDAHVHNTNDDYGPQTQTVNWMECYLWYGITTILSEGEQGPGYPRFFDDPIGAKATAIFCKRVFDNFRPGGFLKFHGGAVVLQKGMTEADFKEMADAGVWLVAEIGGGGAYLPEDVLDMVGWAKKYGFKISTHIGPSSIPGSAPVFADIALAHAPHKFAHINGGSIAAPWSEIQRILDESDPSSYFEYVAVGNQKMADRITQYVLKKDQGHRIMFGSDTPTGQGALPNGIQRMVMRMAAFNDVPPPQAIAMGTGNTADLFGLNTGKIEVGREADILAIDVGQDAVGKDALEAMTMDDTFGVSMVMVDGQVVSLKGRDGRPTRRFISIDGKKMFIDNINEYLFGPYFPGYLH
ncbi:MAG: amidohydrolase family protein [Anaerolineae bacterium]|nr:amidohydrolase family protein [Anaerolineae bacterium]